MHRRQRTIRNSKSCKGVGLHTGVDSIITFHPAPENYGIRFVRSDIKDSPEIKADIDTNLSYLLNNFDFPRSRFSKYERALDSLIK